jgi:hypothetical protein
MADITLSTDRYMALIEAERRLSELDAEYDKATECGIECQELRSVRVMLGDQIAALKKNYSPKSAARLTS